MDEMLNWRAGRPSVPRGTIYYITAQPDWTICRLICSGVDLFCLHRGKAYVGQFDTSDEAKKLANKLQAEANSGNTNNVG